MLNQTSSRSLSFAHVSLAFVGLMWVLPFLYYHHAYPITTFYQEWSALLLSLCALPMLLANRYWQQPELPRIILLPVGMIFLLLLQYGLGKISGFEQTLLFVFYFLWIILLMLLGHALRAQLGLETVATVLAVFLLAGAGLNTLCGLIQHFHWHTFLNSWVTVKVANAVYGNIAQPNHYADYLTLGLASIGLLYSRNSLRHWQAALLVAPMLFVMVVSGSRSAWLYLIFMAGMSYLWYRRDAQFKPVFHYALLLLPAFALMHGVAQIPWLADSNGEVTTLQRMFGEVGSTGIRVYLWHESWLIFSKFPLLGAGFGQFAWQHFQLGDELRDLSIMGLYNNAHNLVMQLAAETGLAGLAIVFGTLAIWLRSARQASLTVYHWWGYTLLAVMGIHSMVEYPLWYAYFIGIAAVALGFMEEQGYRLQLHWLGRASVAMMILLGVVTAAQLQVGYKLLEHSLALRPTTQDDLTYGSRLRDSLLAAKRYTLLDPYAELYLSGLIEVSEQRLPEKLALNEKAMRFIPMGSVAYRQAWLLALDGQAAAAELQLERSLWSYPTEFHAAYVELQQLALKYPSRFSTLLKFATQKYEEYRRAAVSGK